MVTIIITFYSLRKITDMNDDNNIYRCFLSPADF